MSDDIIKFNSISELHQVLGIDSPSHPLISVIDISKVELPKEFIGKRMSTELYNISLKDASCGLQYGRNTYDFEEGVMSFIGPNQVIAITDEMTDVSGWMLFVHPDLLRRSHLGSKMAKYSFFSYDVFEALHLSLKEEAIMKDIINKIEFEYDQNIDQHTQDLLITNLELLLNYCLRFYDRQFHTRTNHNKDVVGKIEAEIQRYYFLEEQLKTGPLTPKLLAGLANFSPNYLSDLLKRETGRNATETINDFVVDAAKTELLNTTLNVNEIAYSLGFNYPHYFSRFFKKSTGVTPQKYREKNLN